MGKRLKMDDKTFRYVSGSESSDSKIVGLLYLLMRDHLPVGKLESIIMELEKNQAYNFTNGFLARNAKLISERLNAR